MGDNMTAELMRSAIVCTDIAIIDAPPAHLAKGNDAVGVRHEGDAGAAWGKIENPERY
jgi:hypothetical protein